MPLSVKGLSIPPYHAARSGLEELQSTDEVPDSDALESEAGGEDGLGGVNTGEGWNENDLVDEEEGTEMEEIDDW